MNGCSCGVTHAVRSLVLTGGPGSGKTATLEVLQRQVCSHVVIVPEAASILWRGGFPRGESTVRRRGAQRAIVRLQIELQRMAVEGTNSALIMCDRGTLDGLAYWPGSSKEYFDDLDTTMERELARYTTVIHLRSPTRSDGYVSTSLRPETADQAQAIDEKLLDAWSSHPRRFVVDSSRDFLDKLHRVLALVRGEIPACCR